MKYLIFLKKLKRLRTQAEFESFIKEIYKLGMEALLKAGIDDYLSHLKHSSMGKNTGISSNGYYGKTLKTNLVDIPLDVRRDRISTFEPVAVPMHKRLSANIEHAIINMYARGMTTWDIEDIIKDIYGIEVSEGTISSINYMAQM